MQAYCGTKKPTAFWNLDYDRPTACFAGQDEFRVLDETELKRNFRCGTRNIRRRLSLLWLDADSDFHWPFVNRPAMETGLV